MESRLFTLLLLMVVTAGCGSTKSRTATEQLIASDAVDGAVAEVDFTPLAGQKVFFDREYIKNYPPAGFVNADYVVSAIRQQIVAAGCLLQDKREDADFVIEGRIGTLGTNSHDIIYGLPANNLLNAAANVVPGAPPLPSIPEISLARKNDLLGAAKLGLFAYHRESKRRVWQSGVALARSTAKDTWIFGAGPFQSGTVYDGVRFAGTKLGKDGDGADKKHRAELSQFQRPMVFTPPVAFQDKPAYADVASEETDEANQKVVPASAEAPAKE